MCSAIFNSVSKIILDSNGFCFTSFYDWSKKFAPLSQPIKWITSTNHALVARVFPRFSQFGWFFRRTLSRTSYVVVIVVVGEYCPSNKRGYNVFRCNFFLMSIYYFKLFPIILFSVARVGIWTI